MTLINDFILKNLTGNSFLNAGILESGVDVDALACRFFDKTKSLINSEDGMSISEVAGIAGIPVEIVKLIEAGVNQQVLGKLALLLAGGQQVSVDDRQIFKVAIQHAQANLDNENGAFWLVLAAEAIQRVSNNSIHECPF